ncbi:MAG: NAD-dependent epimerase/dehydratase family protein [Candidatus Aminicenantes bacterium]|nr:NAD-dependent epimerase/dehydratase family protein [Candidatus Aminicenantes bacterium]MDH5705839.1 NAD-dependent epimerase/dehydratase family protein [Candidatus Aminicenantes bacterium]
MTCLVTGAAGFIASHLCRKLLIKGHKVLGIDSFTDYYPRWIKEKNLDTLTGSENFEFIEKDLTEMDLKSALRDADYVFHHAAQAGVRASWGDHFSVYSKNNIEATQKLLEASKDTRLTRFIFASSSSVYGSCPELPMSETSPLHPFSPYGVTKLAAEHLCLLYHKNYGVPCVCLRFFTVYGPGQRPDMAFHKFFKAIVEDKEIPVYGEGGQTRDFTYIDDVIEANLASLEKGKTGEVYNIGGGNRKKLKDLFPVFEEICQKKIKVKKHEKQPGDVPHTFARIEKARKDLGFSPQTQLQEGLKEEWRWVQSLYHS